MGLIDAVSNFRSKVAKKRKVQPRQQSTWQQITSAKPPKPKQWWEEQPRKIFRKGYIEEVPS